MKLSQYAAQHSVTYRTAWNRYKAGKIEGAYLDDTNHVIVPDITRDPTIAVIYARVSSNKQKNDLEKQAERLKDNTIRRGYTLHKTVAEVASGVNDERPKLTALFKDDAWGTLIIENRDRLTRVGYKWLELFLNQQGRSIVVVDQEENKHDLVEDLVSIIYSFSARLYGQRSAKHAQVKQDAQALFNTEVKEQ